MTTPLLEHIDIKLSSLTFQSPSLALVVASLRHWREVPLLKGMDDSLPITNNPLLPFFPTVIKESPKSFALIKEPKQPESITSDPQHAQENLSNNNDAELMTSLEKW